MQSYSKKSKDHGSFCGLFYLGNGINREAFIYYYHPDHLGSSSYITDINGEVTQHVEYFAFGETFLEEHSNTDRTPYLFNAKELDEETGLYYYGARYYDAKASVWQSVDPPILNGHYLNFNHDGGVLNSFNLGAYVYCRQNPVFYTDPDGNQTGFDMRQRWRDKQVFTGEMTHEEYMKQNNAEGYGALVGLSLLVPDPSDIIIGGAILRFFGLASKSKKVVKVLNKLESTKINKIIKGAYSKGKDGYYSGSKYRQNLQKYTKDLGGGMDAHHNFPKADDMIKWFKKKGLDPNNPTNMSWMNSVKHSGKGNKSAEHLKKWRNYMKDKPNETENKLEILQKRLIKYLIDYE